MLRALAIGSLIAAAGGVAGAQPRTGALSGRVTVKHKNQRVGARVVVYLEKVSGARPRPKAVRRVSQKKRKFRPSFLVITRGTEVSFPNDDTRTHNVYSKSEGNHFNFGHYRKGTTKKKRFTRPGIVDIRCNIHPDMQATILVLDNDYFDEADASGRYAITRIPPGKYKMVAWVPFSPRETVEVEIKANQTTRVRDIVLEEGNLPPRVRRDGTPHPFYLRP